MISGSPRHVFIAFLAVNNTQFGTQLLLNLQYFSKFQGTNRRLYRPVSTGIFFVPAFSDCPSQNRQRVIISVKFDRGIHLAGDNGTKHNSSTKNTKAFLIALASAISTLSFTHNPKLNLELTEIDSGPPLLLAGASFE